MHLLLGLLTYATLALARVVSYTFDITNGFVSPDGFNRSAITVNGLTPGPILSADKGDEVFIRVENRLSDGSMQLSTTIHWHGLFQRGTAHDDGVAFVTQCPISPKYHSHLRSQYIDGLRGPLVIYDHDGDEHRDLYDIDDHSTIISLTDWYHTSAEVLRAEWMANKIAEPAPDSNLFNGIGRYRFGPEVPRAVIHVEHGKRYRFRLINMSAVAIFNVTVEGHPLTVIEADGVNHHPHTVSVLTLAAGQRYSVVLHATQKIGNYWMAYPSNFRGTLTTINPNYNGTEAFAVLRYNGAPDAEPQTQNFKPNNSNPLFEHQLRPLHNPPPPTEPPVIVNITYRPADGGTSVEQLGGAKSWLVNDVQYIPPTVPTLLEILTYAKNTNQSNPSAGVYVLPSNRTIDVRLIGDEHHPFHLHGHNFQVLQSAEGPWNEIDPPIRDTVVSSNGSDITTPGPVTIRFRTNNPGPWFLHCHKNWHMEAGLAVVFAESPEQLRDGPNAIKPSPQWEQLCDSYHSMHQQNPGSAFPLLTGGHRCRRFPCVAEDNNEEKQEIITNEPDSEKIFP